MKLVFTGRFAQAYDALPSELKDSTDKALRFLAENPRHPSLRLKKMQGTIGILESRIDRSYRMTLEVREGYFLMRNLAAAG